MNRRAGAVGRRFWAQSGFSLAALVLMVVTVVSREWIEFLTGWDPDRGSGSFEWVVVAVLGLVAIGFGIAARSEWRRRHQRPGLAKWSDGA